MKLKLLENRVSRQGRKLPTQADSGDSQVTPTQACTFVQLPVFTAIYREKITGNCSYDMPDSDSVHLVPIYRGFRNEKENKYKDLHVSFF